jgi:uncharacterized protein YjbI with pentapeptide repeats
MANEEHIAQLMKGVDAWNAWHRENRDIRPDLSGADLHEANLEGAHLSGANLSGANLSKAVLFRAGVSSANLSGADLAEANLVEANLTESDLSGAHLGEASLYEASLGKAKLRKADLSGARLSEASLHEADLRGAILVGAQLRGAYLGKANLSGANLSKANLREAILFEANLSGAHLCRADLSATILVRAQLSEANLIEADLRAATLLNTDLTGADLTGCRIYGVSAWNLKSGGIKQQNLIITDDHEPQITVDNIEVAQFVYLMLHNEKIRDVIDTIGKKGVLLLGRFTEGRIQILERLREKLRSLGFVPMVFNFDKPETKDFTETVRLLANLSRFVIVDITNPRSTPLELQATVSDYMVPFAPVLQEGEQPFAMFVDLQNKYDWVLQPVIGYPSVDRLIEVLEDKIVRPAEAKFNELLARRTKQLRVENV